MSEIENKTKEKRRLEQEEAAKKKKKNTWLKIGAVVFVVLFVFLSVYESSFITRVLPAAEVDDEKYSAAEYNWLYTSSYYEIYNSLYEQYGSYVSIFLDTSKSLKKQQYSEDMTWADYIRDYTNQSLVTLTALYKEAKAADYVMDDSYYDTIEQDWTNIVGTAQNNGYTVNDYLAASYGRGVNEEVYKKMYERYLYAYSYGDSVRDGFEITSADVDARYEENKNEYDRVSYQYYLISGSATDDLTAEEAMAEAKAKAEEALAAEDVNAYIEAEFDSELNTANYASYSSINSKYADWIFDESRQAGDKEIFETDSGYYVIIFNEKNDIHYNMVSVRHILVKPEDTSSDASWDEAKELAEGYLETLNSLGATEENFGYMALAYSGDSGSQANGGLYSHIAKGQMVTEFEDWCFDPARKEGDIEIIKTSYGYHIMYFVSTDEDFYTYTIDSEIRSEQYSEYIDGIKADYAVVDGIGKSMTGKHI